jgi:hypothetical protein
MSEFPKNEQIVNLADYMSTVMTREQLAEYVYNDLYETMKHYGPDAFLANCEDLGVEPEFFLHKNYEIDRGGLNI